MEEIPNEGQEFGPVLSDPVCEAMSNLFWPLLVYNPILSKSELYNVLSHVEASPGCRKLFEDFKTFFREQLFYRLGDRSL